jgi:tRNA(fMet)-specific endonuclease VapC
MTRFLLDTGIASDYLNRRYGVFDRAREAVSQGHRIGIAVPVLAELAAGIEKSQSCERNMQHLKSALGAWRLWPFDVPAAYEYGRLYAELARAGRPMQAVDIMVAAIARALGNCTVVSADSDFTAVPGITLVNWRS